jgi:hypothetical protein
MGIKLKFVARNFVRNTVKHCETRAIYQEQIKINQHRDQQRRYLVYRHFRFLSQEHQRLTA